jgi:hypothetical protein|tara:strand:+ start:349 stop:642 length:294 start_codon:yes stop_codon:yes gene_type:complete
MVNTAAKIGIILLLISITGIIVGILMIDNAFDDFRYMLWGELLLGDTPDGKIPRAHTICFFGCAITLIGIGVGYFALLGIFVGSFNKEKVILVQEQK